jgi:hypothetical protein
MVPNGYPRDLNVRGDFIFYQDTILENNEHVQAILKMHKQGKTPVAIAREHGISNIVTDDTWVYWIVHSLESGTDSIRRVSLSGGEVQTILTLPRKIMDLAIRGPCVYYVDADEQVVFRVDPERGHPARVVPLRSSSATIVFDEHRTYVSEYSIGHIWVIGK